MDVKIVLFLTSIVCVYTEYVGSKSCNNVDNDKKCIIKKVKLHPSVCGPNVCLIRRNKRYKLSIDVIPQFAVENGKLKVSMNSDTENTGDYNSTVLPSGDACGEQWCAFESNAIQFFDYDFIYKTKAYGKFPIQVKFWNEDDVSEACCFTFNVNVFK